MNFGNIGTRRINKDGSIDYLDFGFTDEQKAKRSVPKYNAYLNTDSLPVTFQIVSFTDANEVDQIFSSTIRDLNSNGKRFNWSKGEINHLENK